MPPPPMPLHQRLLRLSRARSTPGPAPAVRLPPKHRRAPHETAAPYRRGRASPSWLRWNDGCVRRLAEAIEAEGRWEDLPVLADALEEAGCVDRALLEHGRRAAGHRPGCWLIDVLLGRD